MPRNSIMRRGVFTLSFCALLALTAAARSIFDEVLPPVADVVPAAATKPASTQPSDILEPIGTPARRPQPSPAEQVKSRQKFKQMFAADLNDSSVPVKLALADKLSHLARRSTDYPADEFVLMLGAIDAAREGADLDLCFRLADVFALAFDVSPTWLKVDAAVNLPPTIGTADANFYNSWSASSLVDRLIDGERFDAADKVIRAFDPMAAGDAATHRQFALLARDCAFVRAQAALVAQSRAKLEISENDPAANLAVGRYLCFVKHAWTVGLPMLAKGSDSHLRRVANAERDLVDDAEQKYAVAGLWWTIGQKETDDRFKRGELVRAAGWYRIALEEGIKESEKSTASDRIADFNKQDKAENRSLSLDYGPSRKTFHLEPREKWTTLAFEVKEGWPYRIIAHGRWKNAANVACGPDGVCPEGNLSHFGPPPLLSAGQRELWYLNGQPRRALIARVQGAEKDNLPTFFVGSDVSFVAPKAGKIELRVNDGDALATRTGGLDVQLVKIQPRWFDNRGEMKVQTVVRQPITLELTHEGGRWIWSDAKPRPATAEPRVTTLINGCYWWPRWTDPASTELLDKALSTERFQLIGSPVGGEVTLEKPDKDKALLHFKSTAATASQITCIASVATPESIANDELLRPNTGGKKANAADLAAALVEAKKRAAVVEKQLDLKFTELDTEHFAIFTDWDPREYDFLRANVEQAYDIVAKQFKTSRSEGVFLGTLPIYMFSRQQTFKRFAKEMDNVADPGDLLGYFMPAYNGFGHMAMWKPKPGANAEATFKAEREWARVLTHEFTHAFIARYRSLRGIPVWLNEGVAEIIGNGKVPLGFSIYPFVRNRVNKNEGLFKKVVAEKQRLAGDDYPVVQTIVETLQALKPDAFLLFFNDIKDGVPLEDALRKRYDLTLNALETAWLRHLDDVR